jgi:thiol:disulfide interchange protein
MRWLSQFLLLCSLLAPAWSQDAKLTLKAAFEPATAQAGEEVTLVLSATVDPQFHAYGTKETTNVPVGLDAAKLKLGGLELVGKPKIPPGNRKEAFGIETFPLPHEFKVTQKFKVPAGRKAGEIELSGEFDYQVCDENMCLPPDAVKFAAKLVVQDAPPVSAPQDPKAQVPVPQTTPDGKVTITPIFEPSPAKPGDTVRLILRVKVDARYHAYGTKETTNIPVVLDGSKQKFGTLERVGEASIPPGGRKVTFGVETFPLPHEFEVTQTLKVPASAKPGDVAVAGVLDYQLCDENSCEPPAEAAFKVTLPITAGAAPTQEPGKAVHDAPKASQGEKPLGTKPGLKLIPDEKVSVTTRFEPAQVRAGESVKMILEVKVLDPQYHAYGTKESTNIPVGLARGNLKLDGLEAVGEAQVPPGSLHEVFGVETYPLPNDFEVTQLLNVPADKHPGNVVIQGTLDYQLCDENHCEDSATIDFRATLPIEAGATRAEFARKEGVAAPKHEASDSLLKGSLWALILACIGGGLFALVMPCTYPMIPITFSFFTKQADARGGKVMTLALMYGLGIVGMFTLIGVLAGVIGDKIVIFSAHWITNVVIGGAFVVFALSLLGLITIQPPAFLMQAAGKGRSVGGTLGVLLMGATLVISSFTCTAPVVALLLLPAVQSGDAMLPAIGMAVFGLTMATPFVLLALLPGRVKALPRSGEWMNTLKVTLGFVELAAALKFFSNAEYAEQLHWLPRELFFGLWIVIFVSLAVYLWGLVPRATVGTGRRVGGLASLAFAGYCLYGALGYPLDFVMTALAPAYTLEDLSEKVIVIDEAGHPRAVDNYQAAFDYAKKNNKLLLINFTGFTCTNCRMVERGILPAASISPILREHFVEARLHMDNPKVIPADRWAVHEKLRLDLLEGRQTTPTYVTVDPKTDKKLAEHVLSGGPTAWEKGYRAFLEESLKAAGRALPEATK